MSMPTEIAGRQHLFTLTHAQRWLAEGGDPGELQRSNILGSRRKQPVWTFWSDHAHRPLDGDSLPWALLVQDVLLNDRANPWAPDQNGEPSWWRTLRGTRETPPSQQWGLEHWSRHWAACGMDPNRWNPEPLPARPCLLAMWLGTVEQPDEVCRQADAWAREQGLDLHAVDPRTGDGAWHWLANPRGVLALNDVDAQTRFARWLIERGVSHERCNHQGVSGWEAWSNATPPEALQAVRVRWAEVERTRLHDNLDLPPTSVAAPRRPRL